MLMLIYYLPFETFTKEKKKRYILLKIVLTLYNLKNK